MRKPLNGTKTHPLTDHAKGALRSLSSGPKPTQEFNAGVVDRLLRGELAEIVDLPSPYKTRKGRVPHLQLTQRGSLLLLSPDVG